MNQAVAPQPTALEKITADRQAVASFMGVKLDEAGAAVDALIALAQQYGLDPLCGHVFLAKQGGEDGSAATYKPAATRDGYLSVANQHSDFMGVQSDVVRAHDTFDMKWQQIKDGGMKPVVKHSYKNDNSSIRQDRGKIIGAWAIVNRQGKLPYYFFAPAAEYLDESNNETHKGYPSAMVKKCAESMALRMSYSIGGFVPADEISYFGPTGEATPGNTVNIPADEPAIEYEGEAGERLRRAMDHAGTYPAAVRLMMIEGKDQDQLNALADEIEAEHGPPPEQPEGDAADSGE